MGRGGVYGYKGGLCCLGAVWAGAERRVRGGIRWEEVKNTDWREGECPFGGRLGQSVACEVVYVYAVPGAQQARAMTTLRRMDEAELAEIRAPVGKRADPCSKFTTHKLARPLRSFTHHSTPKQ
jgi:hypothetical protein